MADIAKDRVSKLHSLPFTMGVNNNSGNNSNNTNLNNTVGSSIHKIPHIQHSQKAHYDTRFIEEKLGPQFVESKIHKNGGFLSATASPTATAVASTIVADVSLHPNNNPNNNNNNNNNSHNNNSHNNNHSNDPNGHINHNQLLADMATQDTATAAVSVASRCVETDGYLQQNQGVVEPLRDFNMSTAPSDVVTHVPNMPSMPSSSNNNHINTQASIQTNIQNKNDNVKQSSVQKRQNSYSYDKMTSSQSKVQKRYNGINGVMDNNKSSVLLHEQSNLTSREVTPSILQVSKEVNSVTDGITTTGETIKSKNILTQNTHLNGNGENREELKDTENQSMMAIDSGSNGDGNFDDNINSNNHNGNNNLNNNDGNSNTNNNANGNGNNNNDNGNGNNNNNNNSNNMDSINSPSKASTRQLVQKLQSIYKLIIKQENVLQERCSRLTKSQGTDLETLWSIYRVNTYLVENYIDFLTTALFEAQLPQDLMIGKEIVEIYRIERRLWVYGCITFLDVLKNFISNFVDPQIWSQFITNVFISISEMLIELPESYRIPWYERLGDLSRMAIALYPRGFIDWKLSSEYWYNKAIMYNYGHGKLYYHMSTVEQNTLSAYVNLGKSVFCKDMFIPSQHYMQLVIDNIYQRAYSEFQNSESAISSLDHNMMNISASNNNVGVGGVIDINGNPSHGNSMINGVNNMNMNNFSEQLATNHHFQHHLYMSHIVEYLKHVEVISMPSFQSNPELQKVVTNYFESSFGVWLKTTTSLVPLENSNFFDEKYVFLQEGEKIKFYFRCSSLFAQSHILQLVGFGNPKNPFAILFDLPLRLKEKKDKRDKKKNSSSNSNTNNNNNTNSDDGGVSGGNNAESMLNSASNQQSNTGDFNIEDGQSIQPDVLDHLNLNNDLDVDIDLGGKDNFNSTMTPEVFFSNLDTFNLPYEFPTNIDIWNYSLESLNETSILCSMVVLKKYLKGPLVCSLPHLLPWCYFIISLGKKIDNLPTFELKHFWIKLIRKIFPWNTIINCLNKLILFSLKNCPLKYTEHYSKLLELDFDSLLAQYNNEEILPEVWQCWGTLWFDVICEKDIVSQSEDVQQFGLKNHGSISDLSNYGLDFESKDENGELFWYRSIRVLSLFHGISKNYHHLFGLNTLTTPHGKIGRYLFTFNEPLLFQNEMYSSNSGVSPMTTTYGLIDRLSIAEEQIDEHNLNDDIASIINYYNQNVVKLAGSKGFIVDLKDFTLSGDRITACIYTSGVLEKLNIQGADDYSITTYHNNKRLNSEGLERAEYMESIELELFRNFVKERKLNLTDSFFILDATSWLRHSARVYKMAMNGIIKLSICLTTFQELRFLRKSKDNTVSDAATRAVIILRSLYDSRKILPLRFTGNVATSIEEHLEFEEKMTWKTHVDEFVIDAIFKSQNRLIENYTDALIFLVSDDTNMRMKAINHKITSIGSRFMFILCNELRPDKSVSTN